MLVPLRKNKKSQRKKKSNKVKVIFGLGNPGQQYRNNRHNVGYMVIDKLLLSQDIGFKRSFKTSSFIARKQVDDAQAFFVKPRVFMNNSGLCVKKVQNVYGFLPENILIIYDDVDLPLGAIRFKAKGSCAGHKGMSSIVEKLGTESIRRLRIGISGSNKSELSDYVLSDFSNQERPLLNSVIDQAASACLDWINNGDDFVMKNYNRRGGKE